MNKKLFWILLPLLTLTACSFNFGTASSAPSGATAELPAQTKLILGIINLDETENAVTVEQAKELLPMFHVLQDLNESDTAAQEEIDGLTNQIQETLTAEQSQAIESMTLSRHDMMSLMQGNNDGSNNSEAASTSGGDGGMGGPPPDMGGGGFPSGMGGGGTTSSASNSQDSTSPTTDSASIPSALFDAVIKLLEKKI